jgi:lipopolysaccharide export system protein LptA
MRYIKIFLLAFAFLWNLAPQPAGAQQKEAATGNVPIHIEADRMESINEKNTVYFSGNVDAKQGELIIRSDEMTVYYLSSEEQKNKENRRLKKLFATGHVEIENEGWVATGDNMEYFETERKVLLTGNTKVWQDNNLVTGDSVLLYLDEGKSIVESGKKSGKRVTATFSPAGETEGEGPASPAGESDGKDTE